LSTVTGRKRAEACLLTELGLESRCVTQWGGRYFHRRTSSQQSEFSLASAPAELPGRLKSPATIV